MTVGYSSAYVLSSEQILLDGLPSDPFTLPKRGQTWSWHGKVTRLDGTRSTLLLENPVGGAGVLRRGRSTSKSIVFSAPVTLAIVNVREEPENVLILSDGDLRFVLKPITPRHGLHPLYLCDNGLPIRGEEYRVVRAPDTHSFTQKSLQDEQVICFTKGTWIKTPSGDALIEDLSVGDLVQTKDNGPQPLLWVGKRRLSTAQLQCRPDMRPIRLKPGAFKSDIPDSDLLVSPHHRLLYSGANAGALFNQPEVLIAAKDLVNDRSIIVDHSLSRLTYYHLLLPKHEILWANGVQAESYHPANATLSTLTVDQRAGLLELFPDIHRDPYAYGPFARRNLEHPEAAILRYGMG